MSSRHQKEKRLRPRNDPYKRDHFNQSKYLRVPSTNHHQTSGSLVAETLGDTSQTAAIEEEYEDFEN